MEGSRPARLHSEALSETLPVQGTNPHVLSGGSSVFALLKSVLLIPSVESELCLRFQTGDCSQRRTSSFNFPFCVGSGCFHNSALFCFFNH